MNKNKKPHSDKRKQAALKASPARTALRIVQGALIGVSAILPGISGGVLSVIFGVYRPLMELLSHPVKAFKTYAGLLLPILVGWVVGFVGLARAVEWMFRSSFDLAVWLFIGLIAGMLPALLREAGKKEGRTKGSFIALGVSTAVFFAFLMIIGRWMLNIRPSVFWYLVSGALWGVSLVIPGMSSSSLLIFLGLYQPMTKGIADLSLPVILPLLAGLILSVAVSARTVGNLFQKHYSIAYHTIIGFVIASTLAIVPLKFEGAGDILLSLGCFLFGFVTALLMDRLPTGER